VQSSGHCFRAAIPKAQRGRWVADRAGRVLGYRDREAGVAARQAADAASALALFLSSSLF